jgi:hypothetical protein
MSDRNATAVTTRAAQPLLRAGLLLCLAACLAFAGCASTGDGGNGGGGFNPLFFADAGKYQYHNCEQLASAHKRQSERQRELKELIDKAETAAGGQIVSLLAYRTDYVAVSEDLRVIDSTQRSKSCRTPSQSSTAIR